MSDRRTERFVAALDATRVEPRPDFVAELGQRIREEAAPRADSPTIRTDEPGDPVRTNLDDHFRQIGESAAPSRQKRWIGVAVAAMVLVVVGIGVLAIRDDPVDVITDPRGSVPTGPEESVPDGPAVEDTVGDADVEIPTSPSEAEVFTVPAGLAPDRVLDSSVSLDASQLIWNQVAVPESLFGEGEFVSRIVSLGPRLVLLGTAQCHDERVAAVWTSEDGYSWSRVAHDDVFQLKPTGSPQCPRGFQEVVVGGSGLVVEGQIAGPAPIHTLKAAVWVSPDGLSWSRTAPDGESDPDNVQTSISKLYAGGLGLVAIGSVCELPPDGPRALCDEGEEEAVVWTSPDGSVWTRLESTDGDITFDTGSLPEKMVASGRGFVGARRATDGVGFWTSPDGLTWTRLPPERESPQPCLQWLDLQLAATDGVSIALRSCNTGETYYNTVWTSTDGTSWSATQLAADLLISDVIAVGDSFVAVGSTGGIITDGAAALTSRRPAIWTSTDGRTWAQVDIDSDVSGQINQVTLGGPGLAAHGQSPDGPTLWVATSE